MVSLLAGCGPGAVPGVLVAASESTLCSRGRDGMLCADWGGRGFGSAALWSPDFADSRGWLGGPAYWGSLRMPDLDGNGRSDLCGRSAAGLVCALRTDERFAAARLSVAFADAAGFGDEAHAGSLAFPDLDGDHFADACARGPGGLLCALGAGDGSFGPASAWDGGAFADPDTGAPLGQLRFGDLDGDGRDDACVRTGEGLRCGRVRGSGLEPVARWSTAFANRVAAGAPWFGGYVLVDVDGDRRADACGWSAGEAHCALSTGAAFGPLRRWSGAGDLMEPRADGVRFADLDGDGRADLCILDSDGLHCALSQGDRFGALRLWEGTVFDEAHGLGHVTVAATLTLVDLNGDHRADACVRTREGVWCAYSDGQRFLSPMLSGTDFAADRWADRPDGGMLLLGSERADFRPPRSRIAVENERRGSADWWVPYPQWSLGHEIEGFTDALSYPAGGTVQVMLSTAQDHDPVTWRVLRTGYYGGLGAREITSGSTVGRKEHLPVAAHDRPVEAEWQPTFRFTLPADAVSGIYVVRLDSARSGRSFLATFVVREDDRTADLIVQRSDFTDVAYNNWDGGLYHASSYNGAVWVSWERPLRSAFVQGDNWGYTAGYFTYEYSMVRWLEKQGYDLTYLSNWDVHAIPNALDRGRAFLSVGHDEYWSPEMRDRVQWARDAGKHIAFFGSDTVDGRIRFRASEPHAFSRTVADSMLWKYEYAWQPLDPSKPPRDNPQDALTGTHYGEWCHVAHPHCETVTGPGQPFARLSEADDFVLEAVPHPALRTLRAAGLHLPHALGYEYEILYKEPAKLPFRLQVLAKAPSVPVRGGPPVMVAYQTAGGAKVFNAGSMHWTHGLDSWSGRSAFRLAGGGRRCGADDRDCFAHANPVVQQITTNVLLDFGARPTTPSPDLYLGEACDWNHPAPSCAPLP